jgi:DNA polymerase-3 subunit delta'
MSTLPRLKGQAFARRILETGLQSGRTASAYIFYGPPGCGKKTAALDLAGALLGKDSSESEESLRHRIVAGLHPDVRLFTPAGASYKKEQILDLLKDTSLRPFEGEHRVFILDRIEALTDASSNTLLKSIEEPPQGFTWILVTTQRSKVLPTIASRCQAVRFHPLDEATLSDVLTRELKVDAVRARDLSALSGGSVKQAAWFESDDGKAMLEQAEAFLGAAASGSVLQCLEWAEAANSDRRSLDQLLNVVWVLLRERWALAHGLPASLQLLSAPPRHGKSLPPKMLEDLMQAVTAAQAALARNANIGLALDNLCLAAQRPAA